MAAKDDCRFCGRNVTTIVRTPNGASRVCDEHVDRVPNPVNISRLPGVVALRRDAA